MEDKIYWRYRRIQVQLKKWIKSKPKALDLFLKAVSLDSISKIVTILVFPFILLTFIVNYEQLKLVKTEISLSTHISILQLIDQAMWHHNGGNRSSYLILKKLQKDPQLKKTLDLQISNIESSYKGVVVETFVENLPVVCNSVTTPGGSACSEGLATRDNLQIFNLINHLNPESAPLWIERAKAAYLLRFIKNAKDYADYKDKIKKVYDELINRMKEENEVSLLVSKMALDTYSYLTNFKPEGVFDFEGAIKHNN